ncbi:MAG: thiamine-phosphate kinase [Dehalococcoidia bacterium]
MTSQPAADEFSLIDRIIARLGDAAANDILVPPGDDAAAWAPANAGVIATTDVLTEGIDWRPDTMSFEDVGWRAVAVNVSDIAAMGATPEVVLVAAVLGDSLTPEDLDRAVDGIAAACRAHNVHVAGGDISRGDCTSFTVTALGSSRIDRAGRALVLRRDTAKVGEIVAVSGNPGAARAGLAVIDAQRAHEPAAEPLLAALRRPVARVDIGLAAVLRGLQCGIDISDGLVQDLGHIAKRSNVGIEVELERLPLHIHAMAMLGIDAARNYAVSGGDDYELALIGRADIIESLGMPLTVIGKVVADHPGSAVVLRADGRTYEPPPGWDQIRMQPWSSA